MKALKNIKKSTWCLVGIMILAILLNVIAWNSRTFCDFYVKNIFPLWLNTYSRFTSVFPFSVGEILIIAGLLLVAFGIISFIVLMIWKKGKRRKIAKIYGKTAAWIIACVFLIQTLNCFILYHCTTFGDKYGIKTEEHTFDDLLSLGDSK